MICYKLKQVMINPNRNNEQKFYRGVLFVIENLENGTGTPFFHNKRFSVLIPVGIEWIITTWHFDNSIIISSNLNFVTNQCLDRFLFKVFDIWYGRYDMDNIITSIWYNIDLVSWSIVNLQLFSPYAGL